MRTGEDWWLLMPNGQAHASAWLGTLDVALTPTDGTAWEGDASASTDFQLLPGDHLAIRLALR